MRAISMRRLEGLVDLPNEDWRWLETFLSKPKAVVGGTDLAYYGQELESVHVLLDGLAVRYKIDANGNEQFLAYLIPSDFCDLHVAILRRMDHSIRTLCPSVVAEIPCEAILEVTKTRPELAKAFWWCSLLNESISREWIFSLGRKPARQRVAHLFCEMFARLESVGLTHSDGSFLFPVTQAQIGSSAGLSEMQVYRSIKALRELGLLSISGHRVHLPDMDAIFAFANFDPSYLNLKPRLK